ncbi:MAG: hypothetical protein JST88_01485 [Bacteroidetes bacterium]|nr:hypothetical protein [Bacteroidota bacterium]
MPAVIGSFSKKQQQPLAFERYRKHNGGSACTLKLNGSGVKRKRRV